MEWLRRFFQNLFSRIVRFFGFGKEEKWEQELRELREKLRELEQELQKERERRQKLERQIQKLRRQNRKMRKMIRKLRKKIKELEEEIERLKGFVPVQIRMRTQAQYEDEAEVIHFSVAREYARKMISDIEKLEEKQEKEVEYVRTQDGAYWYFRVRTNPTGTEEPPDPRWGTVLSWLIDLEAVIPEKPYVLISTISSIGGWDIDIQRRKGGYVLTEKWEAGRNSGFAEISVRIGQTALEEI